MKTVLLFSLLLTALVFAKAEPIVVGDYGGVSSGLLMPDLKQFPVKDVPIAAYRTHFPIRSVMRPGVIEHSRAHGQTIPTPVFILGVDEDSLQWLDTNYDHLSSIEAIGLVTNIDRVELLTHIRQQFPAVQFSTIPVDDIARQYHLQFYPVLINHKEIIQ